MKKISERKTFDIQKGNWMNCFNKYNSNNKNEENIQDFIQKKKDKKIFYDIINKKEIEYQYNSTNLSLYVLTWNMKGKTPEKEEIQKLFPFNNKDELYKYDIFVIGTQECLRSINLAFFIESKEEWENQLKNFFGEKYVNIVNSNLNSFHLCIFIKVEKLNNITNIMTGEIKSGFLNLVGNKGAVAASFEYLGKKLVFISSHLDAGEENYKKRNESFQRINEFLILNYSKKFNDILNDKKGIKINQIIDEINNDKNYNIKYFDIVVFLGDLNYRVNTDISTAKKLIKERNISLLLEKDQLINAINKKEINIDNYKEGKIDFYPTYQFNENTSEYNFNKRIPSWTDRILFKSKNIYDIKLIKYSSIENVLMSDHKPVYATFKIKINNNLCLNFNNNKTDLPDECKII